MFFFHNLILKVGLPVDNRRVSVVFYLHSNMEEEEHGRNVCEDDEKKRVNFTHRGVYTPLSKTKRGSLQSSPLIEKVPAKRVKVKFGP